MTTDVPFYRWTIDPEALALLLRRRNYTAYRLAAESGINRRHLYRMLKGERANTTRSTITAIATILDVDVHLIGDPRFDTGYSKAEKGRG